jgi:type II secretory pathway pseudopilin PulG
MQFIIGIVVGIIIAVMVPSVGEEVRDITNQAAKEVQARTEKSTMEELIDKVK